MNVVEDRLNVGWDLIVKDIGLSQYGDIWEKMRHFTDSRGPQTNDELWLMEHYPVFTLGQTGKREHLFCPCDIPVVQTDRGGQVTYHGPGQLVGYLLCDVKRRQLGVHRFVSNLEQSMIRTLQRVGISANRIPEAPGVYTQGKKIGALGLRIRKGCSYHGISLNVSMDLTPFSQINPCGLVGMQVSQICDFVDTVDMQLVKAYFVEELTKVFDYRKSMRNTFTNVN